MRYAVWLGSLLLLATSAAASDADLLDYKCVSGNLSVTAKAPWHTYPQAPWQWDKGSVISKDLNQIKFKGPKCEGKVKAFIQSGDEHKGPIVVAIR